MFAVVSYRKVFTGRPGGTEIWEPVADRSAGGNLTSGAKGRLYRSRHRSGLCVVCYFSGL